MFALSLGILVFLGVARVLELFQNHCWLTLNTSASGQMIRQLLIICRRDVVFHGTGYFSYGKQKLLNWHLTDCDGVSLAKSSYSFGIITESKFWFISYFQGPRYCSGSKFGPKDNNFYCHKVDLFDLASQPVKRCRVQNGYVRRGMT